MIESMTMTDRVPVSIWKKLNPAWWLVADDGWNVPTFNNGLPYIPEVTNVWMRRFYWFICRNPLQNFVGYVLGAEDKNYTAIGSAPVNTVTPRDQVPPVTGWKWSVLLVPFSWPALVVTALATAAGWFFWPLMIVAAFACFNVAGPLPFVALWTGRYETYLGWRPVSGGFGFKFAIRG